MPKTQPSTLSDKYGNLTKEGVLQLTCPRSWKGMTQEQLRYALHVIGCGMYSPVEGRTLMLLRFTGIEVLNKSIGGWACAVKVLTAKGKRKRHFFFLQAWQVQDMIKQLEYVDSYEAFDVRLESIGGFKAVDALLRDVPFGDYLHMEKHYQGYLQTKEMKHAVGLARFLYPYPIEDGDIAQTPLESIDDAELTNCVMWFSYVKKYFASLFTHFFKPVDNVSAKSANWLEQMNAQIRALTDGDITKEDAVKAKQCYRALTELDAKAREAEEFRKKYPRG
jgi:hypothetical protein